MRLEATESVIDVTQLWLLSIGLEAKDILLRAGRNPASGQSLLADLAGGVAESTKTLRAARSPRRLVTLVAVLGSFSPLSRVMDQS
jgi:hypothetical protein